MKKILKISLISILILAILFSLAIGGFLIYSVSVSKVQFSKEKIAENTLSIQVYNANNALIKEENTISDEKVKLSTLPGYVKEAFISIEDKDFYKHHGLNYKRMAKAMLTNIKNMKLKEGASTISQQLIKNTHLTSQKTFSRKINEIFLALELEKNFTKEEILEYYLNIIYFGDNSYGIESASKHYFSKSAKELTLDEACTLAGMIKSPNYYSPVSNPDRCKARRNLVLKEMLKDGKISEQTFQENFSKKLTLNLSTDTSNKLNSYAENAIVEASKILKMPAKQIALNEYKIYTFQSPDKQKALNSTFESLKPENDSALISINAKNGAVEAFIGNSNYRVLEQKRQPGSAIKPILVYAPAINEDIIYPATQILDEPISIDGYSPKNVGGKYSGYVSARECLSKSLNVPTIKIASYVGLDKMKNYISKLGIELDKKDNNYAICLGGFTYGTSLQNLAGAYTSLANGGKYNKPQFVSYITDKKGKIVYKSNFQNLRVFREDTACLITDMLETSAKTGTAKKLASFKFDVASKTGTVGTAKGNTDAYNVSYTQEDVFAAWVGNMDNSAISTVGGGLPTEMAKEYFTKIYSEKAPDKFLKPSSIEEVDLDALELENNHRLVKANSLVPEKYRVKEIFSKFNLPDEVSETYLNVLPARIFGSVDKSGNVSLWFDAQNFMSYEVYKVCNGEKVLLKTIENKDGKIEISDKLKNKERAKYYIITSIENYALENEKVSEKGNDIELVALYEKDNKWYLSFNYSS